MSADETGTGGDQQREQGVFLDLAADHLGLSLALGGDVVVELLRAIFEVLDGALGTLGGALGTLGCACLQVLDQSRNVALQRGEVVSQCGEIGVATGRGAHGLVFPVAAVILMEP